MQRDEVVLHDIVNATRLVKEFIQGFEKESFIQDWKHVQQFYIKSQ